MKSFTNVFLFMLLLISYSLSSTDAQPVEKGSKTQLTGNKLYHNGDFKVTGKIINAPSNKVYIEALPLYSGSKKEPPRVLDTATIAPDGSFTLQGTVSEKTFGLIAVDNNHTAYIILDGSDYQLTADYNNFQNYTLKGNPESQTMRRFFMLLQSYYNSLSGIKSSYTVAVGNHDSKENIEDLRQQQDKAMDDYFEYIHRFADTTTSGIMALYITTILPPNLYLDTYKKLLEKFGPIMQGSPYLQLVNATIDEENKYIDQPAPEISLPDPQGDTLHLSDLRGQYVLIDFWASWCRPCRAENPNVVRIYDKYHDKGFTIFSVSLDQNKASWVKAIKDDNLKWPTHVSELAFWHTKILKPYGIHSIPSTFLVDKKGNIIARNLRGFTLEKKLKEIFGE